MRFSDRTLRLNPSDIRRVGKIIAARPGIISFAGGLPDPDLFPLADIARLTDAIFTERGTTALQYGPTTGYPPLREKILTRLADKEGVLARPENLLVTSGSQQGIAFSAMLLLNPGDTVITESPSYLGALNAFRPYECSFAGVAMDEDGMIMEDLEKILRSIAGNRIIYVIPNFQNPTGRTWSAERRRRLLETAARYDAVIIEDNPYGELRFEGEHLPTLKSLDTDGRVIYLGSFSKLLCPGLRVAYICADEEFIRKVEILKEGADLQSNQLAQMQVEAFLETCDFEGHIEKLKTTYGRRRDMMIDILDSDFPEDVSYIRPAGGMFVWLELPKGMKASALLERSVEKGVAYVPGDSFFPEGGVLNTCRLNFSNMTEKNIEKGMRILSGVLNEVLVSS